MATSAHASTSANPPYTSTNVLIISADPRNASRLRLATERRELEDALRGTRFRDQFDLRDIGSCRVRDITRALDEHTPKIVHFSGHGDNAGIYFERDNGEAVAVNKPALGSLLGTQEGLELVVLNACYSQEQAQAIADAVGYVVGMEGAILDEDAIEFSREFYRALGNGRNYEDAFERARLAVCLTSSLHPHLLKTERLSSVASSDLPPKRMFWSKTCIGHERSVLAIAFAPNGRTLASASSDGTLRLWDPNSGAELRKLSGHTDTVNALFFSTEW